MLNITTHVGFFSAFVLLIGIYFLVNFVPLVVGYEQVLFLADAHAVVGLSVQTTLAASAVFAAWIITDCLAQPVRGEVTASFLAAWTVKYVLSE